MARSADILVVGGGVMGAAIALRLAEQKTGSVWMLEKRHLAAGSSGKSGAILRQHYSHPETVRMAKEGLTFYREFEQRYGTSIGFAQYGLLFLIDPRDESVLRDNVAMQQVEGVPTRILDEHGLAQVESRGFYPEGALGCYEENAGSADPRRAVEAMAHAAEQRGVRLSLGEEVLGLLRDGDRVLGVRTSHGEIEADHTVLATGPWSKQLLLAAGWDLPLSVVRPQQAFLEPPAEFGPSAPIFADLTLGAYWKPEGPRHTRVGLIQTHDDDPVSDPDHYDEGVSRTFVQNARETVGRRLPGYQSATIWGGCGALYTMTPDSHPLIGSPAGVEGLTLVTGFSGHGFKMAPAVARGVVERIETGTAQAWPKDFFALDRFERNVEIRPSYRFGILG